MACANAEIQRFYKHSEGHFEYFIKVLYLGKQFAVKKRYRDFAKLDSALRKYGYRVNCKLPPKSWLKNNDPDVLLSRQKLLQIYIDNLLKYCNPSDNSLIREFFEIDVNFLQIAKKQNVQQSIISYQYQQIILKFKSSLILIPRTRTLQSAISKSPLICSPSSVDFSNTTNFQAARNDIGAPHRVLPFQRQSPSELFLSISSFNRSRSDSQISDPNLLAQRLVEPLIRHNSSPLKMPQSQSSHQSQQRCLPLDASLQSSIEQPYTFSSKQSANESLSNNQIYLNNVRNISVPPTGAASKSSSHHTASTLSLLSFRTSYSSQPPLLHEQPVLPHLTSLSLHERLMRATSTSSSALSPLESTSHTSSRSNSLTSPTTTYTTATCKSLKKVVDNNHSEPNLASIIEKFKHHVETVWAQNRIYLNAIIEEFQNGNNVSSTNALIYVDNACIDEFSMVGESVSTDTLESKARVQSFDDVNESTIRRINSDISDNSDVIDVMSTSDNWTTTTEVSVTTSLYSAKERSRCSTQFHIEDISNSFSSCIDNNNSTHSTHPKLPFSVECNQLSLQINPRNVNGIIDTLSAPIFPSEFQFDSIGIGTTFREISYSNRSRQQHLANATASASSEIFVSLLQLGASSSSELSVPANIGNFDVSHKFTTNNPQQNAMAVAEFMTTPKLLLHSIDTTKKLTGNQDNMHSNGSIKPIVKDLSRHSCSTIPARGKVESKRSESPVRLNLIPLA